jgi:hypothetical protein
MYPDKSVTSNFGNFGPRGYNFWLILHKGSIVVVEIKR